MGLCIQHGSHAFPTNLPLHPKMVNLSSPFLPKQPFPGLKHTVAFPFFKCVALDKLYVHLTLTEFWGKFSFHCLLYGRKLI